MDFVYTTGKYHVHDIRNVEKYESICGQKWPHTSKASFRGLDSHPIHEGKKPCKNCLWTILRGKEFEFRRK